MSNQKQRAQDDPLKYFNLIDKVKEANTKRSRDDADARIEEREEEMRAQIMGDKFRQSMDAMGQKLDDTAESVITFDQKYNPNRQEGLSRTLQADIQRAKKVEEAMSNLPELEKPKAQEKYKKQAAAITDFDLKDAVKGEDEFVQVMNSPSKPIYKATFGNYGHDGYGHLVRITNNTMENIGLNDYLDGVSAEVIKDMPRNRRGNIMVGGKEYTEEEVKAAVTPLIIEANHEALMGQSHEYRDEVFKANTGMTYKQWATSRVQDLAERVTELRKIVGDAAYWEEKERAINTAKSIGSFAPEATARNVALGAETEAQKPFDDFIEQLESWAYNDFGSGFSATFDGMSVLTGGLVDLFGAKNMNKVLEAAERGEKLDVRGQAMLELHMIQEEIAGLRDVVFAPQSTWNKIGEGVGTSAGEIGGFAIGMLAGGGIGSFANLGVKGAVATTKYAAKKSVLKGIGTGIAQTTKVGTRLTYNAGLAYTRGAVGSLVMPSTYTRYYEGVNSQYSVKEDGTVTFTPKDAESSFLGYWVDNASELTSEMFGVGLGKVLSFGSRWFGRTIALNKIAQKMHLDSPNIKRAVKKLTPGKTQKKVMSYLGVSGGAIAEPLSEVYGDFSAQVGRMAMGLPYDFNQFSDADYWKTTAMVSTIYGGSLSVGATAMNVPSLYNVHQLGKMSRLSLNKIEDEELRNKLELITIDGNIERASQELAGIDWSNIASTDRGYAFDYIRHNYAYQVALGERQETTRMNQFAAEAHYITSLSYRGIDGKAATGNLVLATLNDGRRLFVLEGNYTDADGILKCTDELGNVEPIHVSHLKEIRTREVESEVSLAYDKAFKGVIEEERMNEIEAAYKGMRETGKLKEEDAKRLMADYGVSVQIGEKTQLVDGREAVVEDIMDDGYILVGIKDATTGEMELLSIPFYDIMSSAPLTAEVQSKRLAERTVEKMTEEVDKESSDIATEEAVSSIEGETAAGVEVETTTPTNGNIETESTADTGSEVAVGKIIRTKNGQQARVMAVNEDGSIEVDYNLDENSTYEDAEYDVISAEDVLSEAAEDKQKEMQETPAEEDAAEETKEIINEITEAESIPQTKDGDIDYDAIDNPEQFAALYEREAGDKETAINDVREMRAAAEEQLAKSVEKGKKLSSANEKTANRNERKALTERIAFYDAVLDILSPRSVENTAQQVDKQGNPLNEDGTLKVEVVASIDEISDADFMEPTRSIQLPMLPRNVDEALGANGKPVVIKKNIFERNATRHYDLTPEQSRDILRSALYNPSLYGQNQKNRKPYNWVVISVATPEGPNRLVLLEINNNRDSIDVVHWHYIDERGIEKIKRQAEREDGQLLILPPNNSGEVGALSDPTLNMPSTGKDTTSLPNDQTSGQEKSHITSDEVRVTGSLGNDIDSGLGNMVRFEGAQAKGRSEHMDAREGYQRRVEEQKREVNAWYNTISQDDAILHDGDTIYVREFSNEHTPNSGKSLMKGTRRNNDAIAIEFTRPLSSAEFRAASDFIWRKGVAATSWQEFVDGLVEAINMTPMEPELASASESAEADIVEPQTEVETTTETTSFTPGLVEDEYTAKLSEKRRKALHDVAVALGLRVRFVDAVRTAAGGLANADISGNEVRIAWSKRDKAISFLVGHEFTHRMQELSPKEYASFKESVKAYMGDERWNALVAKTRSIYEAHNAREMARAEAEHRAPRLLQYSVELIEDEVVADFAGELNEDANALAAFAEKLAEKPSTLKAVIAVLRDILNKLKGLVAGAEAQRLANMLSKFEELYRASASRTTEGQTQSKEKYSLSDEQAAIIIEAMKANAVVAPQIELTPENWVAEFGAEGVVSTPIGEVKMSSNQYQKMEQPDRRTKLGMVKPTLTNPDVIIEEPSKPKDGKVPERNSSYVFVKAFTNADGTRDYMFTSVSNRRDGIEIVMSNQEKETPRIKRLLKEGKLAYINKATLPSEFTASAQGDQSTIPSEVSYSESKDTTSSPIMQEESTKFSLRELDASYLDAVELGDMETAQRMVLEAAKLAMPDTKVVDDDGNPKVVYHGTPNLFNVFSKEMFGTSTDRGIWGNGFYFSESPKYADTYKSREGKEGRTISAYLNIKSPLHIYVSRRDDEGQAYFHALMEKHFNDEVYADVTKQEENMRKAQYELSAEMINDGYDGVIVHYPNDFMGNEYIAFEPNQIKSAEPVTYDDNGNVIPLSERFNFEKEDIRYSIPSQPIFYSNAEYAVRGIKQEKATPEQWLKMIEKNGGLKAGEDKWLGLSDWLKASDKKTLTKDEVLQYIAENDIQIEEVEYAQFGPGLIDEATRKLEAEMREIGIEAMREKYDGFDDLFEVYKGELLWSEERASEGEYEDFIIENNIVDVNAQANAINETRLGYTTNGLDNKREIALTVPTIEPWNTSDNIHFGDAGEGRAVAWIRFGETTDADGKRVLVIDEIQSKRHQEGRDKGYRPIQLEKEILLAKEKLAKANRELGDYKSGLKEKYDFKNIKGSFFERHQIFYDALLADERAQLETLAEKRNDAEAKWQSLQLKATGIPSAPFEKNWAELAMKRMLRYAAENGFDKVAWTTGDQQAERYDLGKSIDYIEAQRNENGTYNLNVATNDDSHYVQEDNISESRLSEVLGKDMMQSIVMGTQDSEDGSVIIEGDGLRIGGEGMKAFYDQMLPSFVRKYAKKWGTTVSEVTMPDLVKNNTMHSVDVTPAMRESVMQGQPKFSLRDAETEKIFTAAKEKFGTTYDMREAGYILPDGSMLDFSGKHQVRDADTSFLNGGRTVDHREIEDIAYDFDENETGVKTDLGDFLDRGAIRIDYNAGAINLNIAPTRAQKDRLKRLIERNDGYVYIDFGKGWDTEHYAEYEAARASRVLGDIDRYFDEGIKPTGNVRFSLSVNDRFNEELATLTEENKDKVNLSLGMPSKILRAAGVVYKPMKLYGAKLWAKSQKHGYKVSDLRDLPKKVAAPIAIFKGSTDGSHAVLTEIKVGENNVLATLSVGKGGEDIDFNIVSSVYGKQRDSVIKWIEDGKLEYVDKEKALNYLHHSAPIAEALSNPRLISTTKVIQNFENPKIGPKKSRRVRDFMPMPDDIFFDDNGDIISFGGDDVREATTIVRRAPKTTEERIKMYIESRHLAMMQRIRMESDEEKKLIRRRYNEEREKRTEALGNMRGASAKIDYILGDTPREALPLYDQALILLAEGEVKIRWEDEGTLKGLASELGYKKGEKARMRNITGGATLSFEAFVHQWWQSIGGYANGIDTQDMRNALIEALQDTGGSSTRALAKIRSTYDVARTERDNSLYDVDARRESALAEEEQRYKKEVEAFDTREDKASIIRQYEQSVAAYDEMESIDGLLRHLDEEIRAMRSRAERAESRESRESQSRKDIYEGIRRGKQAIMEAVRRIKVLHYNSQELNSLLSNISAVRSIKQLSALQERVENIITSIQIREENNNFDKLLNLRLPNWQMVETWVNEKVYNGVMTAAEGKRIMSDMWRGTNSRGVAVAKYVDQATGDVMRELRDMVSKVKKRRYEDKEDENGEVKKALSEDKELSMDVAAARKANGERAVQLATKNLRGEATAEEITEMKARYLYSYYLDVVEAKQNMLKAKSAFEEAIGNSAVDTADARSEYFASKEAYRDVLRRVNIELDEFITKGRDAYKSFMEAQEEHRQEIVRMGLNAIGRQKPKDGIPLNWWQTVRAWNRRSINNPYWTFETTLREIDHLSPNGKGVFYNFWMQQAQSASDEFVVKQITHVSRLGEKINRLWGFKYSDPATAFMAIKRRANEKILLTIKYTKYDEVDGDIVKRQNSQPITIANGLYMLAMWGQERYRRGMEKQGITVNDIMSITQAILNEPNGEQYIAFKDWVIGTFLTDTREEYDVTHQRMFGTSMDKEANYFPAKVVDRHRDEQLGNDNNNIGDLYVSGIIRRQTTSAMIDAGADFFAVLGEHIQSMDRWSAFAELQRDIKYLINSNEFKDRLVAHMPGKGDHKDGEGSLYHIFFTVAEILLDKYKSKATAIDNIALMAQKGWATANISWRWMTAIKQLASLPTFLYYADDSQLNKLFWKNVAKYGVGAWKYKQLHDWCKSVSPSYRRRWQTGDMGIEFLGRKISTDSQNADIRRAQHPKVVKGFEWFDKVFTTVGKDLGMFANKAIDAFSVAVGLRTIYEFEVSRLTENGKKELTEEIKKEAVLRAEMAFNATQQSSENAYLAEIQKQRSVVSAVVTTYLNQPFAMHRLRMGAMNELWNQFFNSKAYVLSMIDKYGKDWQKEMRAARHRAYAEFMQGILSDYLFQLIGTGIGGVCLLSAAIDDDEDETLLGMVQEVAFNGLVSTTFGGYLGGNLVQSAIGGYFKRPSDLVSMPAQEELVSGVWETVEALSRGDATVSLYNTLVMLARYRYGVDPETALNIIAGVEAIIKDEGTAEGILKILNAPRSQVALVAGKRREGESVWEYIDRRVRVELIGATPPATELFDEDNMKYIGNLGDDDYKVKKLFKEYNEAQTAKVWKKNLTEVERLSFAAADVRYADICAHIGWTPGSMPKDETIDKSVRPYIYPAGLDSRSYKTIKREATAVEEIRNELERFVGTDEAYAEKLRHMYDKMQKLINIYDGINK